MKTTDEMILELGNKFAALERVTSGQNTTYQAESVYLKGGRHFVLWGMTPNEALVKLVRAVNKYDVD